MVPATEAKAMDNGRSAADAAAGTGGDISAAAGVSSSLRPDGVLVVTLRNPPANALSRAVLRALSNVVREVYSQDHVRAVVLTADHQAGMFSSGADISEFRNFGSGGALDSEAAWIFQSGELGVKPVAAAVAGICFGGAFELVMSCACRVATEGATFCLPEVRLGIIPGYGGTQRLPRLVGFERGVKMILHGQSVSGKEAHEIGIVEELVSDPSTLIDVAAKRALGMSNGSVPKVIASELDERIGPASKCREIAEALLRTDVPKLSQKGRLRHYEAAVDVALQGAERGAQYGFTYEQRRFMELVQDPASRGLVHLFFAQRATTKIGDVVGKDVRPGSAPRKAGVVGGGLMGAGIATTMLQAGIEVTIKEVDDKCAQAAEQRVCRNLKLEKPPAALRVTTQYTAFKDADIVVEAALESPTLKQDIFVELERHTRPTCVLASNTSTINLDLIAAKIPQAHSSGRVVGAHFFSPAHKMPLLEIVRTESTSGQVIQDVLALAKSIKKTPIVVGNCAGFCVNRMYFPQAQVADMMAIDLGISPYRIDEVMEDFGLPMGPFRLLDLVGLDIGVSIGEIYNVAYADRSRTHDVLSRMVAAGRKGQKTGNGYYAYDANSRAGRRDGDALAEFYPSAAPNAATSAMSAEAIIEMLILPCVNEACRLLHERVALKPSDVDVGSVLGMAFPSYHGGLLHYASETYGGARGIFGRLQRMYESRGGFALFQPSFALARAAALDAPVGAAPTPARSAGHPDDIVVVAALRTAVGRAGRGSLKDTPIDDMLAPLVRRVLADTGVAPADVDDVVVGTVLGRGDSGLVQTRVGSLLGGLPTSTPCKTVNRLCSSGLQAIADAAAAVQQGSSAVVLAGGAESMSLNSFVNKELRPNPLALKSPPAGDAYLAMGQTSENVAQRYGVTREAQDRVAVLSHARASAAQLSRRQHGEIVPLHVQLSAAPPAAADAKKDGERGEAVRDVVFERDEGVRMGVTLERLAKLPTVFRKDGSTTAGNASQISDGAALVMLMKRRNAHARALQVLGCLRAYAVAGVEPSVMGIGPVAAIPKALDAAGVSVADIDVWEVNEAFGSQVEYSIENLGLPRDVLNVNGGAIAIGHPLGMTGARMTVSLLHEMHRRQARFGVVSMCVGTGMGAAAVYEITREHTNGKL